MPKKTSIKYIFLALCLFAGGYLLKGDSAPLILECPISIPVNVETRAEPVSYSQVGIVSRQDIILPLMGRRWRSDKWQYYAISNTGVITTKLPITFRGKKGSSEYGCDEISNGDMVYVEGYQDTFRVTLYENEKLQYIPYL